MAGFTSYSDSEHHSHLWQVAHSVTFASPGQAGFCVPRISYDPQYLERLQTLLARDRWVKNQQVNINAGSITIDYHSEAMPDPEMRSHLADLIESAAQEASVLDLHLEDKIEAKEAPALVAHPENTEKTHDSCRITQVREKLSKDNQTHEVPTEPSPEFEKTHQQAEQPSEVSYSITHAISGRVRFRVPRIAEDPEYVQRLQKLLKTDPIVTSQRINSAAASIAITYAPEVAPSEQVTEQAISHLSSLIQAAASDTPAPTA